MRRVHQQKSHVSLRMVRCVIVLVISCLQSVACLVTSFSGSHLFNFFPPKLCNCVHSYEVQAHEDKNHCLTVFVVITTSHNYQPYSWGAHFGSLNLVSYIIKTNHELPCEYGSRGFYTCVSICCVLYRVCFVACSPDFIILQHLTASQRAAPVDP